MLPNSDITFIHPFKILFQTNTFIQNFLLWQSLVLSMKGANFLNTCRFIPIFWKFEQVVTDIRKVSHWTVFSLPPPSSPLCRFSVSTRSLQICWSQDIWNAWILISSNSSAQDKTFESLFLPVLQHKIKYCWKQNSTTYWHLSCLSERRVKYLNF